MNTQTPTVIENKSAKQRQVCIKLSKNIPTYMKQRIYMAVYCFNKFYGKAKEHQLQEFGQEERIILTKYNQNNGCCSSSEEDENKENARQKSFKNNTIVDTELLPPMCDCNSNSNILYFTFHEYKSKCIIGNNKQQKSNVEYTIQVASWSSYYDICIDLLCTLGSSTQKDSSIFNITKEFLKQEETSQQWVVEREVSLQCKLKRKSTELKAIKNLFCNSKNTRTAVCWSQFFICSLVVALADLHESVFLGSKTAATLQPLFLSQILVLFQLRETQMVLHQLKF